MSCALRPNRLGGCYIGFDVANRSWVTSTSAVSLFESLPPLSGVLYTDNTTLAAAADDFGHIVHRQTHCRAKTRFN
jgi:hypothetical protein